MLVVMKKKATDKELERIKEYLVELDCDFHQSTGTDRVILGVVGKTDAISDTEIKSHPGVLEVFRIPEEEV